MQYVLTRTIKLPLAGCIAVVISTPATAADSLELHALNKHCGSYFFDSRTRLRLTLIPYPRATAQHQHRLKTIGIPI